MCLLSRRIITPTLSFTAYRTYGEIVQTAVQKNCITPWTAAERGIPSLKIGTVSGECWEIKNVLQVSYENLMDWIYTVCRNIGGTANIRLREVDTGWNCHRGQTAASCSGKICRWYFPMPMTIC